MIGAIICQPVVESIKLFFLSFTGGISWPDFFFIHYQANTSSEGGEEDTPYQHYHQQVVETFLDRYSERSQVMLELVPVESLDRKQSDGCNEIVIKYFNNY